MGRLTDLGTVQAMTPRIFHKFLRMLDQIAAEKEKELHIIAEIEAVEQRHNYYRKNKQLHKVHEMVMASPPRFFAPQARPKQKTSFWLGWLLVFASQRSNNVQDQKLKVG